MKVIQAIRGMDDILPDVCPRWQVVESILKSVSMQYGYSEIRFPVLEHTELFSRSIGEATDIVEKEMYTFLDRNGDSLTLRPEGTASCIRAGLEHGLFYNQSQRLFYCGPMFRHERPQKGRYRQFHQFGVEAYGFAGPDIDVEIILLAAKCWRALGIDSEVELQINSLGNADARIEYRKSLVKYLNAHHDQLDEDCKRRLNLNPMRILDSKNPDLSALIKNAPKILDYLDVDSKKHFDNLCILLDKINLPYTVNPRLVRGLDYYTRTVFEWVTSKLGSQNAICAGGHYDGLVAHMGGRETSAIGFAIGLERLVMLAGAKLDTLASDNNIIYLVVMSDQLLEHAMQLAEKIRANKKLNVIFNCGGGSLSSQLKRADKSGAGVALIFGENEFARGEATIKYLRDDGQQFFVKLEKIPEYFQNMR